MNWKSGIFLLCAAAITLGVVFFLPEPAASPPNESPPPVAVLPEPRDTDDTVSGLRSTTTPEGRVAAATTTAATYVTEAAFYQELEYLNTLVTALARPAIPQAGILMLLAKLQGQVTDLEADIDRTSTRDARQDDEDRASSRNSVSELTDNLTTEVTTETLAVSGNGTVTGSLTTGSLATTDASFGGPLTLTSIASPGVTSNKLYNVSGDLYWAGSIVGGSTVGTWTTDGTNVWRAGGNVGVGTSSPSNILEVERNQNSGTQILVRNTDTGTSAGSYFVASNGLNSVTYGMRGVNRSAYGPIGSGEAMVYSSGNIAMVADGASIKFGSGTNSSIPSMIINSNRFVGIGVGTPSNRLSVSGNADFTGNVGIGTSTPDRKLSVVGNAYFGSSAGGNIFIDSGSGRYATISTGNTNGVLTLTSRTDGNSATAAGIVLNTTNMSATRPILDIQGEGSSKLFITNAGNVGIGTTSPGSLLTVSDGSVSGASFEVGSGGAALTFTRPSINYIRASASAGQLYFGTGGTDGRMVINQSGNVGIGTTSPQELLNLYSATPKLRFDDSAGGYAQINGDGASLQIQADQGNTEASSYIGFKVDSLEYMRINSSGNVGIGTTGPGQKLHVSGGTARFQGTTSNWLDINATSGAGNDVLISSRFNGIIYDAPTGAGDNFHRFRTGGTNRLEITSTGNVGIGTTAPDGNLHVHNASAGTVTSHVNGNLLTLESNGSNGLSILVPDASTSQIRFGSPSDNSGAAISYTQSTKTLKVGAGSTVAGGITQLVYDQGQVGLTLNASGNVGIGTTSPSSKLSVAGTIQATNLSGGSVNLTTDANGNIIRDPSDQRLKTNVVDLENALETILELRGVSYEWVDKERFGAQLEIGFIAQEVELVLPEVVRKDGEYWSLNTRNILAVVVEAIKELWAMVMKNSERVDELEERVKMLENELNIVSSEDNNDDTLDGDSVPDESVDEPGSDIVDPASEPEVVEGVDATESNDVSDEDVESLNPEMTDDSEDIEPEQTYDDVEDTSIHLESEPETSEPAVPIEAPAG